jgi:hypothetical protein
MPESHGKDNDEGRKTNSLIRRREQMRGVQYHHWQTSTHLKSEQMTGKFTQSNPGIRDSDGDLTYRSHSFGRVMLPMNSASSAVCIISSRLIWIEFSCWWMHFASRDQTLPPPI